MHKSNPSIIEFNNESLVIANRNINAPQHNRFDFITMIYIDSVFVWEALTKRFADNHIAYFQG